MQILSNKQVSYCNIESKQSGNIEYLPGMLFQEKIFIKYQLFSLDSKDRAIEYCRQKYLEYKGEKSYILVEDSLGFIVWVEDKSARIIGKEDPLDVVNAIDLEDLVAKMRSVGGIKIKDRRHNLRLYKQCFVGTEACDYLIDNLELSIEQAIELGQRLIDEKWIHHVVDERRFHNRHYFYRFYWDEN